MHIPRALGIEWVFTTGGFIPFEENLPLQINDLHRKKSSAVGPIRQGGLKTSVDALHDLRR